jgi:hypothetical protein
VTYIKNTASVKAIDSHAFSDCISLKVIKLPKALERITCTDGVITEIPYKIE